MRYADVRHVKSLFTNIQKQYNMLKISLLFKKFTILRANDSRIIRIKNAKFLGYYFHTNTNVLRDFQICISVPLNIKRRFHFHVATHVICTWSFKLLITSLHQLFFKPIRIFAVDINCYLNLISTNYNTSYP